MDKKKIFVSTKKPFVFSKNRLKVVVRKVLVGTHSLLAQALLGPEGLTPVSMTDGKNCSECVGNCLENPVGG